MFMNFLMFMVVFTMWFSGGMIPFFLLVRDLGLLNNRLAVILPRAVSTYNLIVTRTAFMGVPAGMEESAKIDGAGDLTILFRILVPLCKPVIAVIVLFYSVAQWNAWFDAMLFFNNRSLFPLQLILREILVLSSTDTLVAGSVAQGDQFVVGDTIKYATVIVATLPILAVYPFLQKYFVRGIMIGALKG
jgi:putative aldouronate transport system permease protein